MRTVRKDWIDHGRALERRKILRHVLPLLEAYWQTQDMYAKATETDKLMRPFHVGSSSAYRSSIDVVKSACAPKKRSRK